MSYEKYRIPPDFELARIHSRSCKLFEQPPKDSQMGASKCGCCNQYVGKNSISICQSVASLRKIGEQVPLFFSFTILLIILVVVVILTKCIEFVFACGGNCSNFVQYHVTGIWQLNFNIIMGYIHKDNDLFKMIEILFYSFVILGLKIYLKRRKYKYRAFNYAIEKRSVQLTNLPKNCSQKQVRQLFKDFHIQQVVFSYKIRKYHKCMKKIAMLKKNLRYLNSRIRGGNNQVQQLQLKLKNTSNELEQIVKNIRSKKKRLSIAFVVLQTVGQRKAVLKKFHCSFISKLFYKLFPYCSKSAVKNQHVNVESAPAPDDIQWENLQNPYLRTKGLRVLSFFICVIILIFGIVSQVFIFSSQVNQKQSSLRQIFSSIVVFIINFLIINYLQYSTNKTQAHISNTNIKLSLIRKITFFMFINVSISPFLIMIYNRIQNQSAEIDLFQNISLTILVILIGNLFKPLLTLISVQRIMKAYKCNAQQRKKDKCELNQLEANQLFEPLKFPIQIYYSLIHASIMMSFFYLGCYQIIILIELPALILLYLVAKWMLIKICKQPRGLSLKLNNLAQSFMRFYVPLYWFGGNLIPIINSPENLNFLDIVQKVIYGNVFQIISVSVVALMLICEGFVALVARKMTPNNQQHLSDYYELQDYNRTYSEANLFFKIYQEGFQRITVRLKKKNMESEQQVSRQSMQQLDQSQI